jgi:GT2 family glycosyltransferase
LISVVIPTRHRNELLSQCLDRLAPGTQLLPADQYEVIVTDDGTQSNAHQLIARRYPWVRWVAGPRRGPASNRNCGARMALGEFIAFTDDDCLPAPAWLAAFQTAIREGVDVYEGKTTCVDGIKSAMQGAPINLTGGWLWSCNMMVRKSLFALMNGFFEGFPHAHMEDTDFRQRVRARGLPFLFVADAIVDHPPRQMTFGTKRARIHECNVILERIWNRQPPSLSSFLYRYARARAKMVLTSPWGAGTFCASASVLIEVFSLASAYPRWVRKYPSGSLPVHPEAAMTQNELLSIR